MRNLINRLIGIDMTLSQLDVNEEIINNLPYYSIFNQQREKQRDLKEVQRQKAKYLNEKHTVLEAIQLECEKEKTKVSSDQKKLNVGSC